MPHRGFSGHKPPERGSPALHTKLRHVPIARSNPIGVDEKLFDQRKRPNPKIQYPRHPEHIRCTKGTNLNLLDAIPLQSSRAAF
jgi:hypothetical protein